MDLDLLELCLLVLLFLRGGVTSDSLEPSGNVFVCAGEVVKFKCTVSGGSIEWRWTENNRNLMLRLNGETQPHNMTRMEGSVSATIFDSHSSELKFEYGNSSYYIPKICCNNLETQLSLQEISLGEFYIQPCTYVDTRIIFDIIFANLSSSATINVTVSTPTESLTIVTANATISLNISGGTNYTVNVTTNVCNHLLFASGSVIVESSSDNQYTGVVNLNGKNYTIMCFKDNSAHNTESTQSTTNSTMTPETTQGTTFPEDNSVRPIPIVAAVACAILCAIIVPVIAILIIKIWKHAKKKTKDSVNCDYYQDDVEYNKITHKQIHIQSTDDTYGKLHSSNPHMLFPLQEDEYSHIHHKETKLAQEDLYDSINISKNQVTVDTKALNVSRKETCQYNPVSTERNPADDLLNLDTMLIELRDISSKWKEFGRELRFQSSQLVQFKTASDGTDFGALIELCLEWIRSTKNPTWSTLAIALKNINEEKLSESFLNIYKTGTLSDVKISQNRQEDYEETPPIPTQNF